MYIVMKEIVCVMPWVGNHEGMFAPYIAYAPLSVSQINFMKHFSCSQIPFSRIQHRRLKG